MEDTNWTENVEHVQIFSPARSVWLFSQNPELPDVPLKPGIGQNIATHASPTATNLFLALISTFKVHSPLLFSRSSPYFLTVLVFR